MTTWLLEDASAKYYVCAPKFGDTRIHQWNICKRLVRLEKLYFFNHAERPTFIFFLSNGKKVKADAGRKRKPTWIRLIRPPILAKFISNLICSVVTIHWCFVNVSLDTNNRKFPLHLTWTLCLSKRGNSLQAITMNPFISSNNLCVISHTRSWFT